MQARVQLTVWVPGDQMGSSHLSAGAFSLRAILLAPALVLKVSLFSLLTCFLLTAGVICLTCVEEGLGPWM